MSKIDDLIKQYCPDGVEFKNLDCIAKVGTGSSNAKDSDNNGKYPFYVRSKDIKQISTYEFDEEAIIIPGEGGIGDIFHYVKGKYALHQRAYRINFRYHLVNTKFAYYYLMSNFKKFILTHAVTAAVKSIRKPMIEKFSIPIPPLAVQEEIVRILDTFTALEAELEAELEARQQQYRYYRDQLLYPKNNKDITLKTLNSIVLYSNTRIEASHVNSNSYVGVDNLLQNRAGKTLSDYVPNTGRLTRYEKEDILIGNIRPYLKKIWYSDNQGGTNGDVLVIRIKPEEKENITPRYLYQVLADDSFFNYAMKTSKGAKMPRGDKVMIMKYKIPIPPLAEQQRIVAILDKFDALVNDITSGLPAEINARRQQYEHYRNKLLTFKPHKDC